MTNITNEAIEKLQLFYSELTETEKELEFIKKATNRNRDIADFEIWSKKKYHTKEFEYKSQIEEENLIIFCKKGIEISIRPKKVKELIQNHNFS